ncbi:hypothetical protein B0H10DRAFT_1948492 [Mycena sp. CBHHK59/15]|nr:hypothetical protein B0H10DRAFT_1948492 [Mycena sp. CBHHK59/15]
MSAINALAGALDGEDIEMEEVLPPEPEAPRKTKKSNEAAQPVTDEHPDGWLWQLGKLSKMTDKEMDEWSSEGDRVQWFRAEADMQRWQEQGEQKLGELLRTNRSFTKMQWVWTELAASNDCPGHKAYAKQKAAMYGRRAFEAQEYVKSAGYEALRAESGNLIKSVEVERAKEAKIISEAVKGVESC